MSDRDTAKKYNFQQKKRNLEHIREMIFEMFKSLAKVCKQNLNFEMFNIFWKQIEFLGKSSQTNQLFCILFLIGLGTLNLSQTAQVVFYFSCKWNVHAFFN